MTTKTPEKAVPVKFITGNGYVRCSIPEATHLTMHIPGPTGVLTLPVITKGLREGTGCWTWNGSVEAPTLRPSVKTTGHDFICHSWINDGAAQFLPDCSHEFAGKTIDLLPIGRTQNEP